MVRSGANYALAPNNRASAYENRRDDDRVIQEVNQTIKNQAIGRASPGNSPRWVHAHRSTRTSTSAQ